MGSYRRGIAAPPRRGASASDSASATRLRAAATLALALALPGLLLATTGGSGAGWAGAVSRSGLAARDRALVRVRVWADAGDKGVPLGGRVVSTPGRRAGGKFWRGGGAVDSSGPEDAPEEATPRRPLLPVVAAAPPAAGAVEKPAAAAAVPPAVVVQATPPAKAAAAQPKPAAAPPVARPPPPPPAELQPAPEAAAFPGASLPASAGSTPADGLDPLAARIAYAVAGSPRALGATVRSDVGSGKGVEADAPNAASAARFGPYPPGPLLPPALPLAPAPRPLLPDHPIRIADRLVKPGEGESGGGGPPPPPSPPTLRLTAADCESPATQAAAAAAQLPVWALKAPGLVERYLPDACDALGPALAVAESGLAAREGGHPPRRTSSAAAWHWLKDTGEEGGAHASPPSDPLQYFATVADENRDGAAAPLPPRAATVVIGDPPGACFAGRPVFARARPCGCTSTILLPALDSARRFGVLGLAGAGLGADDAARRAAAFKAADGVPFAERAPGAAWRGGGAAAPLSAAALSLLAAHGAGAGGASAADPRLDVGLVRAPAPGSPQEAAVGGAGPAGRLVKPALPLAAALARRVVLALSDGDGDASLAWALASKSALAMPPPTACSGLMEDLLVPWTHFIPLHAPSPGANVTAALDWCESNLAACEAIGAAGAAWIADWRFTEARLSEVVGRVAFADGRV